MKFTLFSADGGSAAALVDRACDLLAVPLAKKSINESDVFGVANERLGGLLQRIVEEERFVGKPQQTVSLHTHGKLGAQRLLLIGIGEGDNPADLRHAAAKASRIARQVGATSMTVALPAKMRDARAVQFVAEGALLGGYKFDRYLSNDESKRPDTLAETAIGVGPDAKGDLEAAVKRAEVVTEAIARTRDLVNEPASTATPTFMAEQAREIAKRHGLEVEVLGPDKCRELGMGMFLAVAQGSDEEPRFIHLSYKPKTATKKVVLIGKGVTFDSGGLSLKPSAAMEDMKTDMAGAATVISVMSALAQLQPAIEVHAIAACTENMPSGKAYKLGDVLRSMAGKTVEINNTDAEGRLTLGDALTYALKIQPDEIFDFATLTGACMVALGPHTAGVMSNNEPLVERWLAAARSAGEEMWHLPLPERLREQLKSEVADMKNTGDRYGGALTAGLFLKEFVGETAWVHVDIAGPSSADKEYGAIAKGGTGFALATIVEYLSQQAA
jgi:leucyl aminopeptidase